MKIPTIPYHALMLLAFSVTTVMGGPPPICMLSPAIPIGAGTMSKATIEQGQLCSATLTFQNPNFPPVNFGFKPLTCLGSPEAEITIPLEVPNGDAYIIWECGQESQTCNHAWITGGTEDIDNIVLDQQGTASCLVPTGTLTSLSTSFGSSTTQVDTLILTEFSTSIPTSLSSSSTTSSSLSTTSSSSGTTSSSSSTTSSSSGTTSSSSGDAITIMPIPGTLTTISGTATFLTASDNKITDTSVGASATPGSGSAGSSWPATTSAESTSTSESPSWSAGSGSTTSALFSTSASPSTSCPMSCINPSVTITQINVETVTVRSTSAVTS